MITACLLNYNRPKELGEIMMYLRKVPAINEILVWDNSGEVNIINYGRYKLAAQAKNDTIYVQDDDCIVNNIKELINAYDGTCLVNNLKPNRIADYSGKDSMVGWGTIFDRHWIGVLDKYIQKFGEDYIFYRETDRIFTMLSPIPRKVVSAELYEYPSACAEFALWRQPEHEITKKAALERCEELLK